jgi:hypothetical protein
MSAPLPKSVFTEAMHRPLRVGFLSPHNPYDPSAFSGTVHHAMRALSAVRGDRRDGPRRAPAAPVAPQALAADASAPLGRPSDARTSPGSTWCWGLWPPIS